jgi:hypothetical protein
MAESIQRILERLVLDGQLSTSPPEIIDGLEAAAGPGITPRPVRTGWQTRCLSSRSRQRWRVLDGSGACTYRPI